MISLPFPGVWEGRAVRSVFSLPELTKILLGRVDSESVSSFPSFGFLGRRREIRGMIVLPLPIDPLVVVNVDIEGFWRMGLAVSSLVVELLLDRFENVGSTGENSPFDKIDDEDGEGRMPLLEAELGCSLLFCEALRCRYNAYNQSWWSCVKPTSFRFPLNKLSPSSIPLAISYSPSLHKTSPVNNSNTFKYPSLPLSTFLPSPRLAILCMNSSGKICSQSSVILCMYSRASC